MTSCVWAAKASAVSCVWAAKASAVSYPLSIIARMPHAACRMPFSDQRTAIPRRDRRLDLVHQSPRHSHALSQEISHQPVPVSCSAGADSVEMVWRWYGDASLLGAVSQIR
jgi:hypothetical protein